jgi:hypothetical protein
VKLVSTRGGVQEKDITVGGSQKRSTQKDLCPKGSFDLK